MNIFEFWRRMLGHKRFIRNAMSELAYVPTTRPLRSYRRNRWK